MNKAGAILGVIAGIFGFLAAIFTLLFGGVASAFGTAGAGTVVGLGWGGIAFSFLVIIFGAVAFAKPKGAGIGLIICSIGGAILGGTFVAICMVLSLVGGVLCVMGAKNVPNTPTQIDATDSPLMAGAKQHIETQPWSTGRMVLYGIFSFLLPLVGVIAGIIGLLKEPTRKQGAILLMLALAGVVMYSAISSSSKSGTSSSSAPSVVADKYAELAVTPAAPLLPTGELAAMFNLLSDNTDLQRENKLKEIKGKVVEWTLSVYEVEKNGDEYKIQTDTDDAVGTFIYISPRNDQDKAVIEALKTGSRVSIKGIIGDDSMRHLVIKPAILFQPGSAKPTVAQAPQPTLPAPEQSLHDQTAWPPVNTAALIGKPASYINSDAAENGRYSKLVGNNAELDDYLTVTLFSDEDASAIQDAGDYLVIISKGIIRKDTGPMEGAYAIHKATGKPAVILLKGGEFTILGATAQSLPSPLKTWAKENGAAL